MTSPTYTAEPKDPSDIEDYGWDCTAWLKGETIASQNVVADDVAVTIANVTQVAGVVRWRASGGTNGAVHKLTATVTSSSGRSAQRTIELPVMDL
jgi:hypothetical protein